MFIYKIIGIGLLAFGLLNVFWYAPYSITLVFYNQPFPFAHLEKVDVHEGGGIGTQVGYMPFHEAQYDPYWLVWSFSLYSGIAILSVLGVKSLRKKQE